MEEVFEENQFKLKDKLTIDQVKNLVATNFLNHKVLYRLYNQVDQKTLDGEVFVYTKDCKPVATAPVRIHVTWGLSEKRFIENYAGKVVVLVRKTKPTRAVVFWQENNMGAFVFYVEQVFNREDFENEQALRRLEEDWLQPDDDFQG